MLVVGEHKLCGFDLINSKLQPKLVAFNINIARFLTFKSLNAVIKNGNFKNTVHLSKQKINSLKEQKKNYKRSFPPEITSHNFHESTSHNNHTARCLFPDYTPDWCEFVQKPNNKTLRAFALKTLYYIRMQQVMMLFFNSHCPQTDFRFPFNSWTD